MTDKEEREQVLETLTNMRDWMEATQQINSTPEIINALNYAISSIKTDLKYDLLYEDNQIADADKMIRSTTKNNSAVDSIDRELLIEWLIEWDITPIIKNPLIRHIQGMPSVTPQEPTTKKVLAVDPIDRVELLRAMDTWDKFGFTTRYGLERLDQDDKGFVPYVKYDDMLKCVRGMSSVTPKGVTVTDFDDRCRECGKQKKGKWVLHTYMPHKNYCSECEKDSPYNKRWVFCPNCGAEMESEE